MAFAPSLRSFQRLPRYRRMAVLLLLCGTVGLGACSAPETTTDPQAAGDPAAEAPAGDRPEKKALQPDQAARRLTKLSSRLYESAYSTNWEQATQQFNRLQKLSDRIEPEVQGIDAAALQQQLDALEEAITAEQQVPTLVAANQLMETGLQASQSLEEAPRFLPAAQLAYQARQLELATLSPDGSGSDPQNVETMEQAAQQVIQTWETMGSSTSATGPSGAATASTEPPAASEATAKLDGAIAQLRQAPVEEYPTLAREIVDGAQKIMTNRQK